MSDIWQQNVRHIVDGELVNAAVSGRPDRDNEGNIRFLKDLVETLSAGRALVVPGCTMDSSVRAGQPVFFNEQTQQFELALADYAYDGASGTIVPAASADCLGVCYAKDNDTLGSVILSGAIKLDISLAAGSSPQPGRYYLSAATPGALVRQCPAVSVPVLYLDTQGVAYVNPLTRNFLADHVHYRFELACVPAGTTAPPATGARHVISAPDPTIRGWLPAAHASFGGRAPVGAAWGYNLAAHPQLLALWPPIPVDSAFLLWDKGSGHAGASLIGPGPGGGLAIINRDGIWWMSDCNGLVPWPADYSSASPPAPPGPDTSPPTCPAPDRMRLFLGYAVVAFSTRNASVTRLTSTSPLLAVTDPDGNPAAAGPLALNLDLGLAVASTSTAGGQVLKNLAGNSFSRGWVAEGVKLSGGLIATADHVDATDPANPIYQGVVTLGVAPTGGQAELAPLVVRLEGAEEDVYSDVPYYRLPAARQSAVYFRFDIPATGLASSPTMTLRLLLTATTGGSLPAFAATARRIARPASGAQVALAGTGTALSLPSGQTIAAFNALEAAAGSIAVAAGDVVIVGITRGASDGFTGDVGVVRAVAVLG